MDTRFIQHFSQKLVLSPQIRQYLKVLQMPLAELQGAIDEFLAENPVVEQKQLDEPPAGSDRSGELEMESLPKDLFKTSARELEFGKDYERLESFEAGSSNSLFEMDESNRDPSDIQKAKDFQEMILTQEEGLGEYLLTQIQFLNLKDLDLEITGEMIGNLDDRGYLTSSLEEIAETCKAPLEKVQQTLAILQDLDPPGVFARDLKETMMIQLKKRDAADIPFAALALQVVTDHFEFLARHDLKTIAKNLEVDIEDIRQVSELIATLEPNPGRKFSSQNSLAVIPDVIVTMDEEDDSKLKIDLRDEVVPQLRISPYYRKLLRDAKTDDTAKKYIREKIQSAMNFMNAMKLRGSTLRGIAEQIVKSQHDFFYRGFTHLKPMRLKDVSAELNIHESTVSRAISGKYMATPQGTIPLRSFFSNRLETQDGEGESQTSLVLKIKQMIEKEDSSKPMSDQEIVNQLKAEGIKLARRTVTKYREMQKILPSHLRRKR